MILLLWTFFLAQTLLAQTTIKGKVTDENNTGIPGVNVVIKGTTVGTATDGDGNYVLNVPAESAQSSIIFSFIGYSTQELPIEGRTVVDVKMSPDAKELSEVVVVGYGTQNKRDVTGAILKVNSDVLLQTASPNAIDQLKGHAAGVDIITASSVPGGGSVIRIRGNRTMTQTSASNSNNVSATSASTDGSNADLADQPLLVVDGIPYNGNLNDISPNDIASMEVLKDASATAIYGSRGSNGVILVTTKRGTSGKIVFNYDAYYGTSSVMKELRVFNGAEYAQFKLDAQAGNSVTPNTTNYGITTAEQAALDAGVSTDWQKLIYKTGAITNHTFGVSGGNDKSKYSLSAGYFQQSGIIPNQDYTRYTVRSTMDHQLNKRIKVGLNTINTVSYQNTPGGAGVTGGLMRMTPLASPYNTDGTVNLQPQTGQTDASAINPLTLLSKAGSILSRTRRLRTFNSFYGEVDIIKGLKYRVNVGLDYFQDKSDGYSGPGTFVNTSLSQAQSQGSVRNTENWQYTVENLILFDKTINEKHKIGFTGLYSFQKNHSQANYVFGQGIPFDYIQNTNLFQAASVTVGGQFDNFFSERGLISYMARGTYSYDGRFSATATVRSDGSSVLSPGNQYYTYPAFSAAWNISNEKFMSNLPVVSSLKLRAGWGITASQNINPYSTLGGLSSAAYNFGQGTAGQQGAYTISNLPNNALKWQNTKGWNIGLEFGVLENRITGAFEVYGSETSDILLPVSLPASNGGGSIVKNAGKTQSNGIELSINSVNVRTSSGLTWSTEFNYFFNREKIVALTPGQSFDVGNGWFVGQPLTVIYDYKKIGIWQTSDDLSVQTSPVQRPGQIKVLDWNTAGANPGTANYGVADGKITPDDRTIIGNFQPQFDAGMTNKVTYKRFDFSISIYARMGMKVVVPYVTSEPGGANFTGYSFFNQSRQNQLKVDYWTPTNPTNAFPQPDAGTGVAYYASTLGYVDGSFIKCRSINLGYEVPSSLLSKAGITSLRFYVQATNPFVIWAPFVQQGYGPDPEGNGFGGAISSTGTSGANAIVSRAVTVNANVPSTRQILFGLNLKF
ncbi:SusC/RagA family TonB-linked outer membrane protein [Cytophagales bacterium WSM2-2]|nr:SusC/RagA family TonB-linked outer membrane protein [Cytophagales bacterium WSM2-2]